MSRELAHKNIGILTCHFMIQTYVITKYLQQD